MTLLVDSFFAALAAESLCFMFFGPSQDALSPPARTLLLAACALSAALIVFLHRLSLHEAVAAPLGALSTASLFAYSMTMSDSGIWTFAWIALSGVGWILIVSVVIITLAARDRLATMTRRLVVVGLISVTAFTLVRFSRLSPMINIDPISIIGDLTTLNALAATAALGSWVFIEISRIWKRRRILPQVPSHRD